MNMFSDLCKKRIEEDNDAFAEYTEREALSFIAEQIDHLKAIKDRA